MSDRWKNYALLLEQAMKLPNQSFQSRKLQAWANVCRPIESGEPRVEIGLVQEHSPHRARVISHTDTEGLHDPDGRRIENLPSLVYDLSGAMIFPQGVVEVDGILSVDEFRGASNWRDAGWANPSINNAFRDYDRRDDTCLLLNGARESSVDLPDNGIYFLFHTLHGDNFGHLMHDTMAQLIAYDYVARLHDTRPIPLLTSPRPEARLFPHPMQKYVFEQMVGPLDQAVHVAERPVCVQRCFGSSFMLKQPEVAALSVDAFRYAHEKLAAIPTRASATWATKPDRVYISRKDGPAGSRNFYNLNEFEAIVNSAGFMALVPSETSPEDTIYAFQSARCIIGVHGAGFGNMLLSHCPRVIEVLSPAFQYESYSTIGAAIGFDYHRVRPLPEVRDGLPGIDLEKVRRLI